MKHPLPFITRALACAVLRREVSLASAALGLGDGAAGEQGHDDLEATYRFRCREPGRLGHIELSLLKAYPRIGRPGVQIVGAKGQSKQVLRRAVTRLVWPR